MKIVKKDEMNTRLFTDGSCTDGTGTCAYAVIQGDDVVHSKAFRYYNVTNNIMELEGCYQALLYCKNSIKAGTPIVLYTDSKYVKDGLLTWIRSWVKNGWMGSTGKPVKNQEHWKKLYELYKEMGSTLTIEWCKGHAGNKYNELVDSLCTEAYKKTVKEPDNSLVKKVKKPAEVYTSPLLQEFIQLGDPVEPEEDKTMRQIKQEEYLQRKARREAKKQDNLSIYDNMLFIDATKEYPDKVMMQKEIDRRIEAEKLLEMVYANIQGNTWNITHAIGEYLNKHSLIK